MLQKWKKAVSALDRCEEASMAFAVAVQSLSDAVPSAKPKVESAIYRNGNGGVMQTPVESS